MLKLSFVLVLIKGGCLSSLYLLHFAEQTRPAGD